MALEPPEDPFPPGSVLGGGQVEPDESFVDDRQPRTARKRRERVGDAGLTLPQRGVVELVSARLDDELRRVELHELPGGRNAPAIGEADQDAPAPAAAQLGVPLP